MNPILYVIMNGSLKMSPGKAAAQAVHAAMMLTPTQRCSFTASTRRSVIVLEANGREQLDGIVDYLTDAGIGYQYYIDEGVNEVEPFSFTALIVEPIDEEDYDKRAIFSALTLYGKGKPKKKKWYQRMGYVNPHEDYP